MVAEGKEYIRGRGAQSNVKNPFEKREYSLENIEEYIEPLERETLTQYFKEHPNKIINKVDSPDLGMSYSMNPYQGCEHGCIYCYARNSHQYWGFSAGLDFERKIMIKENAPSLLRKAFDNPKWVPEKIMLSGNTDCYQPVERKMKITQRMLQVCLEYRNPVGIITKNSLILRDKEMLQEMATLNLVSVSVSITSLNEDTRLKMEPRTTTAKQRLKVVEELSKLNIPVNIMVAHIIPSINDHEIPDIIKAGAEHGANSAGYNIVRLNGSVGEIFTDWVHKNYPDRAEKVLNQIAECHGGKLNDSRFGVRMKGEGVVAETIRNLFTMARQKYMKPKEFGGYDPSIFRRPPKNGQLTLF
jgi:DNA repair photolyase